MKPRKKPWINLAVFENENDARTLDTFLQHQGFQSRTYNDRLLQLFLFLCPPHATYRVQIRANDHKSALYFLTSGPFSQTILSRAVQCPSCGSYDAQYPQMTRKFFLPTILLHLGIIFRVIQHEAYCEHCHFTWHLSGDKVSPPVETAAGHP